MNVGSSASKTNLASLKTEVDKIDVLKLQTVPLQLAKLSNVGKNNVVKKVNKVNKIDTTKLFQKPNTENRF